MTFKDREKMRLAPLKWRLFSQEACRSGMYRGARREFCLHEDFSAENVEAGIRDAALAYFEDRGIGWHDSKGNGPSNGTYICWLTEWQCLPLDRAAITMLATRHVHEV